MQKRHTFRYSFRCWNNQCEETYSLLRDINDLSKLVVACPFCDAEAVADLAPHRTKSISIMRGDSKEGEETLDLTEIIPTRKKTADDDESLAEE